MGKAPDSVEATGGDHSVGTGGQCRQRVAQQVVGRDGAGEVDGSSEKHALRSFADRRDEVGHADDHLDAGGFRCRGLRGGRGRDLRELLTVRLEGHDVGDRHGAIGLMAGVVEDPRHGAPWVSGAPNLSLPVGGLGSLNDREGLRFSWIWEVPGGL